MSGQQRLAMIKVDYVASGGVEGRRGEGVVRGCGVSGWNEPDILYKILLDFRRS